MELQGNPRVLSPSKATWPSTSYGVIRFLRLLLAFIVLSHLCISLVEASVDESVKDFISTRPHRERQNIIRRYQLHARCSEKLVRLRQGRLIRANGKKSHRDTVLSVESLDFTGNVRIQSERYKRYICFDKRGILTSMEKETHEGCKFREIITEDGFTEFQSVRRSDWYIGFRRGGKPIRGRKKAKKDKCYQFLKLTVQPKRRRTTSLDLGIMRSRKRDRT